MAAVDRLVIDIDRESSNASSLCLEMISDDIEWVTGDNVHLGVGDCEHSDYLPTVDLSVKASLGKNVGEVEEVRVLEEDLSDVMGGDREEEEREDEDGVVGADGGDGQEGEEEDGQNG